MSPEETNYFADLGSKILRHSSNVLCTERVFRANFGVPPNVSASLWNLLWCTCPENAHPKHLLWAFRFLKLYETWDVLAWVCDVHVMTLRKWIWPIIEAIAELKLVISKQFFQFF